MSIVSEEETFLDIVDIVSEETFGFLLLAAAQDSLISDSGQPLQFLRWPKQKLNFEIVCAITLDILPAGWKA